MTWDNSPVSINAAVLLQRHTLELIDSLSEADASPTQVVRTVARLRQAGHNHDVIHQALEQLRLRRRARDKFGPYADQMLFTEAGLEQASRLAVAAHHAGRFQRAGIESVADLGCGLGGDSMAYASLGLGVLAVDNDQTTAALASYNLALFDNVSVVVGDALDTDLAGVGGVWMDPARRDERSRHTNPGLWSPPLDEAVKLARRFASGIKLAPGMDRDVIPDGVEAQWVSHGGDVVEMVWWFNGVAQPHVTRSALVLGQTHSTQLTGPHDSPDEPVRELGDYLVEPDGAVIRARLIGDLARQIDGGMIAPEIAYITTDVKPDTGLGQCFRVVDVLPLKTRDLAGWVKRFEVGTLEIKKRGVDVDPATLRRQLKPDGPNPGTLILTRLGGRRVAIVVERLN